MCINYFVEKGMEVEEMVRTVKEKMDIKIKEKMIDIFKTGEEGDFAMENNSELRGRTYG